MVKLVPHDEFLITLADDTRLILRGDDGEAARVVAFLAQVARLSPAPTPLPPAVRRLLAVGDGRTAPEAGTPGIDVVCVLDPPEPQPRYRPRPGEDGRVIPEHVAPAPVPEARRDWRRLARLSAAIGRETQRRGGALLHSALACRPLALGRGTEDEGVLLAGPSGTGKSTASTRLPAPWRSLADDMTLVVRRDAGAEGSSAFWAHPWPTWSRFFGVEAREAGGRWDVQRAVPLRALFFLEQGTEERAEPVGPGEALCRLAKLAQDTSRHLLRGWPPDEIAEFNLQRFENLCVLVRAVPAFRLHVRLDGAFWERLEEALGS